MAKVTLPDIGSAYGSVGRLNANFDAIQAGFENTLSRDGTSPNQMEADLDMNSNAILNASSVTTQGLILNGVQVSLSTSFLAAGFSVIPVITATAGQTSFSTSPVSLAVTSLVMVSVNGFMLPQTEVSFSGSTVTLPAMEAGDEVQIIEIKVG